MVALISEFVFTLDWCSVLFVGVSGFWVTLLVGLQLSLDYRLLSLLCYFIGLDFGFGRFVWYLGLGFGCLKVVRVWFLNGYVLVWCCWFVYLLVY